MQIKTKTLEAIEYAGSKSRLAALLGITRQSLTSWGPCLPQTSAQKLYILTNGKVGKRVEKDTEDCETHEKNTKSSENKKARTRNNDMFYP